MGQNGLIADIFIKQAGPLASQRFFWSLEKCLLCLQLIPIRTFLAST